MGSAGDPSVAQQRITRSHGGGTQALLEPARQPQPRLHCGHEKLGEPAGHPRPDVFAITHAIVDKRDPSWSVSRNNAGCRSDSAMTASELTPT
jgi:hypothetical protein